MRQYQTINSKAVELAEIFDDSSIEVLLNKVDELLVEKDKLVLICCIEEFSLGDLNRHLNFLNLYLNKNDKDNCKQDTIDIVLTDLPIILKVVIDKYSQNNHFDSELQEKVLPLVDGGEYDSAIRKSFVILSDNMRRLFSIHDNVDGEELVNRIFGTKSYIAKMEDDKKQAYRNLFCGFYAVYRNKFAHSSIEPTIVELTSILEMTNSLLIDLKKISDQSSVIT